MGAVGFAGLAGCTGSADGEEPFRLSIPFFPETLEIDEIGFRFRELGVFETLVRVTREGDLEGLLATDWVADDEAMRWQFELREGVTFHDGSPLTAEAVAFSLERALELPTSRIEGLPVESVQATDERTVTVETTEPLAPLPAHFARADSSIISPNSVDDSGEMDQPISTGPFQFESWEPESEIVVERFEEYYGPEPHLGRIVYTKIEDGQTRTLSLLNDEIDLANNLPIAAVEDIESDDDTEVLLKKGVSDRIIVFNTAREPFDDRQVRQAFMHAVDKQAIVDDLLEGVTTPAYGPWDESINEWANPAATTYAFDPDQARSLLDSAGWELDADEEVRYKDGTPLDIELWAYTERPNLPTIAEAMQFELDRVGFDTDVRVSEFNALDEAKQNEAFDVSVEHWPMFGDPSDPDSLSKYYDPAQSVVHSHYDNSTVVEQLDAGRQTTDRTEREAIYNDIQEIVTEDVPVGFLARQTHIEGVRSTVEGYDPNPLIDEFELENVEK